MSFFLSWNHSSKVVHSDSLCLSQSGVGVSFDQSASLSCKILALHAFRSTFLRNKREQERYFTNFSKIQTEKRVFVWATNFDQNQNLTFSFWSKKTNPTNSWPDRNSSLVQRLWYIPLQKVILRLNLAKGQNLSLFSVSKVWIEIRYQTVLLVFSSTSSRAWFLKLGPIEGLIIENI